MNDFQRNVIDEFRSNGGKVGGMFEGASLALLTTIGARTGLPRTVPLGCFDIEGRRVVVASAAGADKNPDWFHNVRHEPRVTVEYRTDTYEATASIPDGADYDELWAKVIEVAPGFADYQSRTARRIPVVILSPR